jgi:hypothetical protein
MTDFAANPSYWETCLLCGAEIHQGSSFSLVKMQDGEEAYRPAHLTCADAESRVRIRPVTANVPTVRRTAAQFPFATA